jgi:hypothetical protein
LLTGFYHITNAANGMALKLSSVDPISFAYSKPLKDYDKQHKTRFADKNNLGGQFANALKRKSEKQQALQQKAERLQQTFDYLDICYQAYLKRVARNEQACQAPINDYFILNFNYLKYQAHQLSEDIEAFITSDRKVSQAFGSSYIKRSQMGEHQKRLLRIINTHLTENINNKSADQPSAAKLKPAANKGPIREQIEQKAEKVKNTVETKYYCSNQPKYDSHRDITRFNAYFNHDTSYYQEPTTNGSGYNFVIEQISINQQYSQRFASKRFTDSQYLKHKEEGNNKLADMLETPSAKKAYQQYKKQAYDKVNKVYIPKASYLQTAAETVENFVIANRDENNGKEVAVYIHEGSKPDPALYKALAIYCHMAGITWHNRTSYTLDVDSYSQAIDNSQNSKVDKFKELSDIMAELGREPPRPSTISDLRLIK